MVLFLLFKMNWIGWILSIIGLIAIIAAIVLDFSAAGKSETNDNVTAREHAHWAGWLSIIGLVLITIGHLFANY